MRESPPYREGWGNLYNLFRGNSQKKFKILLLMWGIAYIAYSVGKQGKKSANCAGKGLIAESGVDWYLKKHTKNPTKSGCCFFSNKGLTHTTPPPPPKQFFTNISLSMYFYGKTQEWRIVPRKFLYRIMYSKLSLNLIVSLQSCPK